MMLWCYDAVIAAIPEIVGEQDGEVRIALTLYAVIL
jgi:hypothetical protein